MKHSQKFTLTFVLSLLAVIQGGSANAAPTLTEQLNQVAEWFTGSFSNSQQVANNPTVPLITLSTCSVQLDGVNSDSDTKSFLLEQYSSAFSRIRFYSFSKNTSALKLSVYSFLNQNSVAGLCNTPISNRVINTNNLTTTSCDLDIFWQPIGYVGNNAPNGCPTSTGGKVVSSVLIQENTIDSLDQIYSASGRLLVSTPIKFQQVNEPSFALGILGFGLWGVKSLSRRRKIN